MIISILVPVVCYEYEVIYDIDLTLISIAIIFPLVFAIRGAFRRREKALEGGEQRSGQGEERSLP